MNLNELTQALSENADKALEIQFDSGNKVAAHFHVTEIGKVTKDFVDCGGIRRTTVSCVMQTLVAEDVDHRLKSDKLAMILEKSSVLELDGELPVEFEIQTDTIGVYELTAAKLVDATIRLTVAPKHTACLAPDSCGLEALPVAGQSDCCGDSGCC